MTRAFTGGFEAPAEGDIKTSTPKGNPLAGSKAGDLIVPVGWARFQADDDDRLAVVVELGNGPPRVTDGYGGWEEVKRPGAKSITSWGGFSPLGIQLDLFLDAFDDGTSVEAAIDVIEAMAGRGRRATGGEPPKLIVDTAGVMPHDVRTFPFQRWVITDLQWPDSEDDTIINSHGNRTRTTATVTLWTYTADTRLQDRALEVAKLRRKKSKRTYLVKSGDTLLTIARAKLGDSSRWREIAQLNGLRDPRAVKAGATIRIP